LPDAPAGAAGAHLATGCRSAAVAGLADREARVAHLLLNTIEHVLEGDLHIVAQAATGIDAAAAAPEAEGVPTEGAGEDVEDVEGARSAAEVLRGRVTVAVIMGTALRIGEHRIGLGDLLEQLLGLRVIGVHIRVVLASQLSIRALDVGIGGLPVNPK